LLSLQIPSTTTLTFTENEVSNITDATATEAAPLIGVKRDPNQSRGASQGKEWRRGREEKAS
jgi:hypothetical protein